MAKVRPCRLSVVIPVFNRSPELNRAVDSVLAQGCENLEILVVDDASTVPVSLPGVPGVRVVRHERNRGAAGARNTGIAEAAGEFVAFLDSDDTWQPGKLAGQLAAMAAAPDYTAGVFTPFAHARAPRRIYNATVTSGGWFDRLLAGCRLAPGSTLLMRTIVARNVGPQDETLERYEDWDWLLRIAHCYELAHAPGPGALLGASGRPALEVVEQSLDRLREKWWTELTGSQMARFRAALAVERAAACRWHRRYGGLVRSLGEAVWYSPETVVRNLAWASQGRRRRRE